MLMIPHCLDIQLTDGSEVVSLLHRLCFTSQKDFLVHISVRGLVNTRFKMLLEGLGKFKKFIDLMKN
jgi:hypothetical protein